MLFIDHKSILNKWQFLWFESYMAFILDAIDFQMTLTFE